MRAEVTRQFPGVVDGEIHPRQHKVGSIVTGDLARAAIEGGNAKAIDGAPENKMMPAPQKKIGGPTGAAKPSSSRARAPRSAKKTSTKSEV